MHWEADGSLWAQDKIMQPLWNLMMPLKHLSRYLVEHAFPSQTCMRTNTHTYKYMHTHKLLEQLPCFKTWSRHHLGTEKNLSVIWTDIRSCTCTHMWTVSYTHTHTPFSRTYVTQLIIKQVVQIRQSWQPIISSLLLTNTQVALKRTRPHEFLTVTLSINKRNNK